ncbi:MAG: glycosyltransferase family 2 protein [Bacteroidetes bacterium]|nr:glycosyltransferase family 2 protein [Bacteroidota bacterium]HET6244016.1 glycosyltransferase family 2 protein [Bacteroidia bacterium]
MFFSIIIPTYNRASFIQKAIESAINQNFKDFEIIIVDDGSIDNTEETVKKIIDERIRYFKISNSERAAARNYGAKKANGKFLTFLDSDDLLYNNYLKNAFELIQKNPQNSFFHLPYAIKSKNNTKKIFIPNPDSPLFLAKGNPLSCIGIIVEKNAFLAKLFNENRLLSGSEDWELWLRIFSKYGLITGNDISACLFNHNDRSVFNFSEKELVTRKELAINSAFSDIDVKRVFSRYRNTMEAYCDSYIALHLMLSKNKIRGLFYLYNSIKICPETILTRRFLGILKHLIIS